jgi:hypothetical protein
VIRRFRGDAANQRAVLDAFEARGWPARIDDPLPRGSRVRPKVRRRETVKALNAGLAPRSIRFFSDGRGLGIRWEASHKRR